MTMVQLVYRFVSDREFANRFQQNPQAALAEAGLSLNELELQAATTVLQQRSYCTHLSSPEKITPLEMAWPRPFCPYKMPSTVSPR
jgi:hypothetical protein